MLKNRDIIIFGDDWGRYPSTIQHIGRVLAENNRVMWIGSLGLRKPEFKLSDLKRAFEKLSSVFHQKVPRAEEGASPVIKVHPFVIPLHDIKIVQMLNKILLLRKLRAAVKEHRFKNPVLITSSPVMSQIVGCLDESSVHYICLDDYSHFKGAFKRLVEFENSLLEKADSCFAVSETLINSRKTPKGNPHYLPQGVDLEHFNMQCRKIPEALKGIRKPVIGYFGIVAPLWTNISLIIRAAKEYPEYEFLIIGRVEMDISGFNAAGNIKYIGEVPYSDLPDYAKLFDVGIIPFEENNLTRACNPIKLYEYLAMGIPVVSTDLTEVRKFSDLVFIAKSEDEFIRLIKTAVEDSTAERNQARSQRAMEYSWKAVTEKITDVILNTESKKNSF
ncbi:MAG: glycosyltransferase family 1 protein [Ignavibacteria bacterium]|jgi:glycosyltransferase involved in cell wall biosynthesis|nr:glycosyltransferase family 1 protein [Ignavibacteria bacterium]MCU7503121.1 glycosyltransferase family 1 protein [Ignavibacteria bacterium]MCU7518423.1 glycosyltransferase family 1 protein [Ignavibacteria bacterium]